MSISPPVTRRLAEGGRIDRSRPLGFSFDGVEYEGFEGDTLASALLASGVAVVGRGIYTGRPRGVFSAGVEEPNALVHVEADGRAETMARATTVPLVDGLVATSLAGKGRLVPGADDGRHDKRYVHCDVLVIGAGPAGLAAALAAGRTGARTILVEQDVELGGSLLAQAGTIDGLAGPAWAERAASEFLGLPETRVLGQATAFGFYDHGHVLVAERFPPGGATAGRLWHLRARSVVLATGAIERPIAFPDNDRPGVMLAGAVRTYLRRFAVRPGDRAVIFTTNDSTDGLAGELRAAGAEVAAEVDARRAEAVQGTVARADGRLSAAIVAGARIDCDLLAVSGGWNPAVHLFSQSRGTLRFDDRLAAFVPDEPFQRTHVAGAGRGTFDLAGCLLEGAEAGAAAALEAGFRSPPRAVPSTGQDATAAAPSSASAVVAPLWLVDGDEDRAFVDLERDVTVASIRRAVGAGLTSVEHIKRYTSIGTASDQGKSSAVVASAIAATLLGREVGGIGMPTFRPPYTPVSFALLAGRDRGALHDPVRVTPIHPWHVAHGAVFEDVGQWKRPRYFPRGGESLDEAVLRECRAARQGVAMMDASTLGKIDLQGPDAGEFLNRVYTNAFAKLPVGSCRYGVMCRVDGMVFDDGVTSRLAEDRFHMTTTTGNAAAVLDHLEEWLQTEWPELRVRCTSVTEQWATVAVVGPRSRDVLGRLAPDLDVSVEGFPFMTWRDAAVAGLPARVYRISFSGELAYEINVAAWHGLALWEAVVAAGEPPGITPYGTEAMHVLRAEKGYPIIGQETDGTVTALDLGMDWVVSKTKSFIGRRSLSRPDTSRSDRKQLVGLLPVDPDALLPEGAQLVDDPDHDIPMRMVGHVTSSYRSSALGRTFALALVKGGRQRMGERVFAPLVDGVIEATITSPVLYDPENLRRDG